MSESGYGEDGGGDSKGSDRVGGVADAFDMGSGEDGSEVCAETIRSIMRDASAATLLAERPEDSR